MKIATFLKNTTKIEPKKARKSVFRYGKMMMKKKGYLESELKVDETDELPEIWNRKKDEAK